MLGFWKASKVCKYQTMGNHVGQPSGRGAHEHATDHLENSANLHRSAPGSQGKHPSLASLLALPDRKGMDGKPIGSLLMS
jgi:hypothetical protein